MNDKIILKNVTKQIKGQEVLSRVNLELDAGGIYGFFGRNGSGKTMLLRAIAGLIRVNGKIIVFGKDLSRDNAFPDRLGLIIEKTELWPQYSAMENLKLLAGIRNEIGEEEIRTALERVGLNPDDKRAIRTYSMGMRQKLALAQAIMESPQLLLLDEPTNGLDDDAVELFRQIMREEQQRGCTILVATHQGEDVAGLCSRVFRMADGKCREAELS